MLEEGIADYTFAKRKAAKFFGLIDGVPLPNNEEINKAMKEYQAIFNNDSEQYDINKHRHQAYLTMIKFEKFNPYLVGLLSENISTKYPKIQINLYVENIKEIEYFLIKNSIIYRMSTFAKLKNQAW